MPIDKELQQLSGLIEQLRGYRDEWFAFADRLQDKNVDLTANQRRDLEHTDRPRLKKHVARYLTVVDDIEQRLEAHRREASTEHLLRTARPHFEGLPAINSAEGAVMLRLLEVFAETQRKAELRSMSPQRLASEAQAYAAKGATERGALYELRLIVDEAQHLTGDGAANAQTTIRHAVENVTLPESVLEKRAELGAAADLIAAARGAADVVMIARPTDLIDPVPFFDRVEKDQYLRDHGGEAFYQENERRREKRKREAGSLSKHLSTAAAQMAIGRPRESSAAATAVPITVTAGSVR